ncbi:hypothetical protein B0A80_13415 [Flavobacterium tructae]|uniref:hypothetical protein n=1 Tax=Flavobacterium tructae TaxID=1114873 RepID=UPI000B5B8429|nr:hypothetical protein [Flavobacterium tructae]OXB22984.1 hypothetical protein B0A80_13415 [Flavobacterium tructae]
MTSLITFIKTIPTEVVPSPPITPLNETLEILTKVNEFYDSAWTKLIFLLAGAFTILGIIMPFVIQHFQNKALKASEKELESKLTMQVTLLKKTLEEELSVLVQDKFAELEKKIEKVTQSSTAQIHHVQGNQNFAKKDFKEAVKDFLKASLNYAKCKHLSNLNRTLANVALCIKSLSIVEIQNLKEVQSIDVNKYLETINKVEGTGAVRDLIHRIKADIIEKEKKESKV